MCESLITAEVIESLRRLAHKRGQAFGIADELFSVAETAVAIKAEKFDPGKSHFGGWAYTVAGFAITDFLRAQDLMSRRQRTKIKAGAGDHIEKRIRVSDDVLAFERTNDPEKYDGPDLIKCLMALDAISSFVMWQYYYGDHSLKEIANFVGVTESRICQIMQGATSQLGGIYRKAL